MPETARWSMPCRSAAFGGQFGSFLRHGVVRSGVSYVFGRVSAVFMMGDQLWVSEEVGRRLFDAGWPEAHWRHDCVNTLVDVPWMQWFAEERIPDLPANLDESYYLKKPKRFKQVRLDAPAFALDPIHRLDVKIVPRSGGGIRLVCEVGPIGLDAALARFVFPDGKEVKSMMPPSVVVSTEARALIASCLEDQRSLRWEEIVAGAS